MSSFERTLDEYGAIWRHDPLNPQKPHAILTKGRHSNGFVNLGVLGTYPEVFAESCTQLADKLFAKRRDLTDIDWVVGPAMGGITVAHELAKELGVRCAYTEKKNGRMSLTRCKIPHGKKVLVCEDALTTGGTAVLTALELEALGCDVIPFIATLVSRTANPSIRAENGRRFQIVSLANIVFGEWDVPNGEKCTLCDTGSPALHPKEHWSDFLAMA